jgi:hypothetical protein
LLLAPTQDEKDSNSMAEWLERPDGLLEHKEQFDNKERVDSKELSVQPLCTEDHAAHGTAADAKEPTCPSSDTDKGWHAWIAVHGRASAVQEVEEVVPLSEKERAWAAGEISFEEQRWADTAPFTSLWPSLHEAESVLAATVSAAHEDAWDARACYNPAFAPAASCAAAPADLFQFSVPTAPLPGPSSDWACSDEEPRRRTVLPDHKHDIASPSNDKVRFFWQPISSARDSRPAVQPASPEAVAAAHRTVMTAGHALIHMEAALIANKTRLARAALDAHKQAGGSLGEPLRVASGETYAWAGMTPLHIGTPQLIAAPALNPLHRGCSCSVRAAGRACRGDRS